MTHLSARIVCAFQPPVPLLAEACGLIGRCRYPPRPESQRHVDIWIRQHHVLSSEAHLLFDRPRPHAAAEGGLVSLRLLPHHAWIGALSYVPLCFTSDMG